MVRRISAAVVLLGLLVLPPLLLRSWGFYAWRDLNVWSPIDYRLLLGALTLVGWAAWVLFAVGVLLELVRLISGARISLRLPGFQAPQALAGVLLTAIFATTAGPTLAASAAPPVPMPSAAVTQSAAAEQVSSNRAEVATAASASEQAGNRGAPTGEAPTDADRIIHVVEAGDDLWSLAQHYYGSGHDWRKIVTANPELLKADPTSDLAVGTALTIENPTVEYEIKRGDTLWHLAEERLGDGQRYREIQKLNADQISDPDYIETGWTIRLPGEAADAPGETAQNPTPASVPRPGGASGTGDAGVEATVPVTPEARETSAAEPAPPATPSASVPVRPTSPAGAAAAPDQVDTDESPLDSVAVKAALGGLAALAASGVVGGLVARRRERQAGRDLGMTMAGPDPALRRFETALGLATGAPDASADALPPLFVAASSGTRPSARAVNRTTAPLGALYQFGAGAAVQAENLPKDAATAAPAMPARELLLDRAQRLVARRFAEPDARRSELRRALLTPDHLVLEFAGPVDGPVGFERSEDDPALVRAAWQGLAQASDAGGPVAFPGLVTLGQDAQGDLVMIDLQAWGALRVDADTADLPGQSLSAMTLELAGSPWADELELWVVTDDPSFVRRVAAVPARCLTEAEDAVGELERLCAQRRLARAAAENRPAGTDPAPQDWTPVVAIFERAVDAELAGRLEDAIATGVGVAAVYSLASPVQAEDGPAATTAVELAAASGAEPPMARLAAAGIEVAAQTLQPETKAAIEELYRQAEAAEEHPASWWRHDDPAEASDAGTESGPLLEEPAGSIEPSEAAEQPVDLGATLPPERLEEALGALTPATALPAAPRRALVEDPEPIVGEADADGEDAEADVDAGPTAGAGPMAGAAAVVAAPADATTLRTVRQLRGPRLRLFGPVRLEGAAGEQPDKAPRRCLEYCAWLLEHPGATASELGRAMFVTDGTRRSNLSRLRSWLGQAPDGSPYLPEAYSGRIALDPAVTSDWAQLRRVVERGVNAMPIERLRQALSLVDGAPLADAAPGEWAWADGLRTEMGELVRDVAVVLARAELAAGRPDAARGAVDRGLLVAPDDELLLIEQLRIRSPWTTPSRPDGC